MAFVPYEREAINIAGIQGSEGRELQVHCANQGERLEKLRCVDLKREKEDSLCH